MNSNSQQLARHFGLLTLVVVLVAMMITISQSADRVRTLETDLAATKSRLDRLEARYDRRHGADTAPSVTEDVEPMSDAELTMQKKVSQLVESDERNQEYKEDSRRAINALFDRQVMIEASHAELKSWVFAIRSQNQSHVELGQ